MHPTLAARYFRLLGSAKVILDVGCGLGDLGRYRPRSDIEVHGVDIDSNAVSFAQEHEIAKQVDLDSDPLPYPDETFDGLLAKDIFEHVSDPGRLASECRRVLRPGGVMLASVVMASANEVNEQECCGDPSSISAG